jgi:hypothetical protein
VTPGVDVGGIPTEKPSDKLQIYVGVGVCLALLGAIVISIGIWLYIRAHKEELQERVCLPVCRHSISGVSSLRCPVYGVF